MSNTAGLQPVSSVAPETLTTRTVSAVAPPPTQTSSPADYRLVIEEDEATGSFIYKTIDRRTGEIVQQLPRADVLKMRDEADYAAGAVHDALY